MRSALPHGLPGELSKECTLFGSSDFSSGQLLTLNYPLIARLATEEPMVRALHSPLACVERPMTTPGKAVHRVDEQHRLTVAWTRNEPTPLAHGNQHRDKEASLAIPAEDKV